MCHSAFDNFEARFGGGGAGSYGTRCILNALRYLCYTSTPMTVILWVFMGYENVAPPPFEKGSKEANFNFINPFLVILLDTTEELLLADPLMYVIL